jgi:hypothetical protein
MQKKRHHCREWVCDDPDNQCPGACGQRVRLARQCFLEREPAVVFFQLGRGVAEYQQVGEAVVEKQRKIGRVVSFPRFLSCFRSGTYAFAGAIQHCGTTTRQGHYFSTVWLGDGRYAHFDDSTCSVRAMSWQDLLTDVVQRQVYVLAYVRVRGQGNAGGEESTPYRRDADSEALFQTSVSVGRPSMPSRRVSDHEGFIGTASKLPLGAASKPSPQTASSNEITVQPEAIMDDTKLSGTGPTRSNRAATPTKQAQLLTPPPREVANSPPIQSPLRKVARLGAGCGGSPTPASGSSGAKSPLEKRPRGISDNRHIPPVPQFPVALGGERARCPEEAEWRRYTPAVVEASTCQARTLAAGVGGLCKNQKSGRSDFCNLHAKTWRKRGRVTEPIPRKALEEFQRLSARAEGPEKQATKFRTSGSSVPLLPKKCSGGSHDVLQSPGSH